MTGRLLIIDFSLFIDILLLIGIFMQFFPFIDFYSRLTVEKFSDDELLDMR